MRLDLVILRRFLLMRVSPGDINKNIICKKKKKKLKAEIGGK